MTAGQGTRHVSNVSLAPAPLAALLAATLLGGAAIGAAITAQLGSADASGAAIPAAIEPAATFDNGVRAEEGPPLVVRSDGGVISTERRDRLGGP